jgi:hypothetical protein
MMLDPVSQAIREELIIKSATVDDALSKACRDLYIAHMRIRQLEREASGGYLRRPPSHPARQPRPVAPAVTDDWIPEGRER